MPNQETLIACRVCDQVFLDNKSLFDHYMRLHVGSFESSVNGRYLSSSVSQITCFTSVPLTDVNSSARPNSSQAVTPSSDISVGGNFMVPAPLRNVLQLRGPASMSRSQLHPFSNFHSAIRTSTLSSRPKQPSNSSLRFASRPSGQPSFRSPRSHITLGISNSKLSPSTSKPIRQLNFHSLIDVGALTSESMSGGTSSLSDTAKRSLLNSTTQSEVQNRVTGHTKPYILQLEHPIEEMTVVDPNDNGGDNSKPEEIDLTLKL
ncbi:hypothetical protein F511_02789 [Dorcoceras hygrometricum]|uniref:C2H2-type domain-containing protein n=1 Tax=Dorcoceras hygrometricum TaxID=472368 RepID=A0A2Z7BQ19_9LAMI|nr:hypothetical protein F511_02789 [Dorcoceras hygrometricum]